MSPPDAERPPAAEPEVVQIGARQSHDQRERNNVARIQREMLAEGRARLRLRAAGWHGRNCVCGEHFELAAAS